MRRIALVSFRQFYVVNTVVRFNQTPSQTPSPLAADPLLAVKTLEVTRQTHSVTTELHMKRRLALQAWRDLQQFNDADLEKLDTYSISVLLSVWAYFAKFWECGRDGPANPLPPSSNAVPDPEEITVDVSGFNQSVSRFGNRNSSRPPPSTIPKTLERKRRNILDETFE